MSTRAVQSGACDRSRDGYALTNYRALCRRGVLWLGQTCNIRCHFCYFLDKIDHKHHPEHAFLPLEKPKNMCTTSYKLRQ